MDDVLGTGYRAAVEQLEAEAAERVREANLATLRKRDVRFIATNALCAVAAKAF